MEFSQPVIVVEKLAECVRFYRDLLGCEVMAGGEQGPVAYFVSGGQRFVLLDARARPAEMVRGADAGLGAPRVTLAFHAADVDAEFVRLSAAGVRFTIEPRDFPEWGVRSSLCSDPDGNPVEIAGAPAGAPKS